MNSLLASLCLGDLLSRSLRLLSGGVFLVAGISKLTNPALFARTVAQYGMLPRGLETAFGYGLASAEVVVGLCLIMAIGARLATRCGQAMLVIFAGVISLKLLQGEIVPCGCFGGNSPISWRLVTRDIGLVVIMEAMLTLAEPKTRSGPVSTPRSRLTWMGGLTATVIVASLLLRPVMGLGYTLVAKGSLWDDTELAVGDQLDSVAAGSGGRKDLYVFLGDDVGSAFMAAWADEARAWLPDSVQFITVNTENLSPGTATHVPSPGLLLVNSEGTVILRWHARALWAWSDLNREVQVALEHDTRVGQAAAGPGAILPTLSVVDVSGRKAELDLETDGKYVLYLFDFRCSMCDLASEWLEAKRGAYGPEQTWIGVALDVADDGTLRELRALLGRASVTSALEAEFGTQALRDTDWLGAYGPTPAREAASLLTDMGLTMPCYLDTEDEVARYFSLSSVPGLVVVERGRIVAGHSMSVSFGTASVDLLTQILGPPRSIVFESALWPAPFEGRCQP